MRQRAADEALAYAGRSGDEDVLALANPPAAGQMQHEVLVQPPRGAIVDVSHAGHSAQAGVPQPRLQAARGAMRLLVVDHQAESIQKRHRINVGHGQLVVQGTGHAGQAHLFKLGYGRMRRHEGLDPLKR